LAYNFLVSDGFSSLNLKEQRGVQPGVANYDIIVGDAIAPKRS
jgi:hypothetical protein